MVHVVAYDIPVWSIASQAFAVILFILYQCNMLKPGLLQT